MAEEYHTYYVWLVSDELYDTKPARDHEHTKSVEATNPDDAINAALNECVFEGHVDWTEHAYLLQDGHDIWHLYTFEACVSVTSNVSKEEPCEWIDLPLEVSA